MMFLSKTFSAASCLGSLGFPSSSSKGHGPSAWAPLCLGLEGKASQLPGPKLLCLHPAPLHLRARPCAPALIHPPARASWVPRQRFPIFLLKIFIKPGHPVPFILQASDLTPLPQFSRSTCRSSGTAASSQDPISLCCEAHRHCHPLPAPSARVLGQHSCHPPFLSFPPRPKAHRSRS